MKRIWIASHDFRLLPLEVLKKSENKDLILENFQDAASKMADNPLVWILYGLNDEGRIEQAVSGYFNVLDHCLYVDDGYNAGTSLEEDEDLEASLKALKTRYGARKIKRLSALEVYETVDLSEV